MDAVRAQTHLSRPVVYVTLQQFCEADPRPKQLLLDAG